VTCCGITVDRRCFVVTIRKGFFSWDFDEKARRYDEELVCGRFVSKTSLTVSEASAAQVLRDYKSLQNLERRFTRWQRASRSWS
jgi:hypothetical protein